MFTKKRLSCLVQMPQAAAVMAVMCLGALLFALVMEYGFGFEPCILCLWQRVPYVLAALFSAVAWFSKSRVWVKRFLILCLLCFSFETGLAVFHSGVERHWWSGTSGCAIEPMNETDPQSIREKLMHMAVARCDQISWMFLGLSMTNYNVAFSFGLLGFSGLVFWRFRDREATKASGR